MIKERVVRVPCPDVSESIGQEDYSIHPESPPLSPSSSSSSPRRHLFSVIIIELNHCQHESRGSHLCGKSYKNKEGINLGL